MVLGLRHERPLASLLRRNQLWWFVIGVDPFLVGTNTVSDPLIERAFSTQDGLVGCRVYWDGAKWVHRHILMCPSDYIEELKFKEYRDIKGTKVSHVKMCLANWHCDRERKYHLVSTAIERLAVSGSGEIDLPMDVYFRECNQRREEPHEKPS